jgi:hypothetical protein
MNLDGTETARGKQIVVALLWRQAREAQNELDSGIAQFTVASEL